ncbi:MAG: DNA polymerase/3'-5' exonuclease PolX [Thermodesulfobacteriota bacterium]|nr:DNA polymerase/3'-5' exonuclease PolX [Thermodesulfobacteriota bacterium]
MKNLEIARIFNNIADLLEIKGDNPFKIRAYRRASQNLEGIAEDLATIAGRGDLKEIPGIGKDLSKKIEEYLKTGLMSYYEELKGEIPESLLAMMAIQGVGPKKAKLFYEALGITNIDELERMAGSHQLREIQGIKEKTEENILRGIALYRQGVERMTLGYASALFKRVADEIRGVPGIERIHPAGSLRRQKETIGDLDILISSSSPHEVMETFVNLPDVREVLGKGITKSSVLTREGFQMDLRVVQNDQYGSALAYFTGSKAHNIRIREMAVRKGFKISEYGIFNEKSGSRIAGEKEEDTYRLLDLPFIPPELREDRGEIEAAMEGVLPALIKREDIRADLHIHSNYSDGAHSIKEIAAEAREIGYEFVAITDHSQSLGIAGGVSVDEMITKIEEIKKVNREISGIRLLSGTEVDIRIDGTLDYPEEVLAKLDLVIASIHSGFRRSKSEQTGRIIKAMKSPNVHIIGHLTGRLLGEREGYEVDLDEILKTAVKTGTAVEINAYPQRLDLNDIGCRRAKELGAKVVINSDAHVLNQLDYMEFGVSVARRGWLEKEDILNTLDLNSFLKTIKPKNCSNNF